MPHPRTDQGSPEADLEELAQDAERLGRIRTIRQLINILGAMLDHETADDDPVKLH